MDALDRGEAEDLRMSAPTAVERHEPPVGRGTRVPGPAGCPDRPARYPRVADGR
ncbi:hypothetical protein [Dactylosporangium sp. AC04546]|uniref:hypothetical protein n=1 Tax=Dactylosporangium sp. AC04546 TaxID=2862460 RepID=UPI003FA4D090